eukprot:scaffold1954_cov33-Attheya_sp.AAC.1
MKIFRLAFEESLGEQNLRHVALPSSRPSKKRRNKKRLRFHAMLLVLLVLFDVASLVHKYYHFLSENDIVASAKQQQFEQFAGTTLTLSPLYNKARLEFLHIPKTGGTSIEVAAGQKGIPWGLCHFIGIHENERSICPPLNITDTASWPSKQSMAGLWHYPLQFLVNRSLPSDPYDNNNGASKCDTSEVHYFGVIRNPYDRMVSEFYHRCKFHKNSMKKKNDPKFMNRLIVKNLNIAMNRDYFHEGGHFIPQHDFVLHANGTKMVHHILRFENLNGDFDALMEEYSLNISLKEQGRMRITGANLTASDFFPETKRIIEEYFAKDFVLGNYTIMAPH